MTPEDYLELHNAVQQLNMDCGNNPCFFRRTKEKGGMRTNGMCRCLENMSAIERRQVKHILRLAMKAFSCTPSTKENS